MCIRMVDSGYKIVLAVCSIIFIVFGTLNNARAADDFYTKWDTKITTDSVGSSKRIEITGLRKVVVNGQARNLSSVVAEYKPVRGLVGRTMLRRLLSPTVALGAVAVATMLGQQAWLHSQTGEFTKDTTNYSWSCNNVLYSDPSAAANCLITLQNSSMFGGKTLQYKGFDIQGNLLYANANMFYSDGSPAGNYTVSRVGATDTTNPTTHQVLDADKLEDLMYGKGDGQTGDYTGVAEALTPDTANGETANDVDPSGDIRKQLTTNEAYPSTTTGTANTVETDPNGNVVSNKASSFELPSFCDYATKFCAWIDWTKEEPAPVEPAQNEIPEENNDDLLSKMQSVSMPNTAYCPSDVSIPINLGGLSSNIPMSYQPLCALAEQARPAIILIAWIIGAYIITGAGIKSAEG